ncbi:Gamma-glutamylcyclotransferase family protein [Aphelenchoides besseyi]|nr:Gamma-glutamylcyclotransferase family protein [Aphelenchoides besseyi]
MLNPLSDVSFQMSEFYVFVYGTLKKGEPNELVMADGEGGRSKFVGFAETFRPFPLIVSTQFNIPFLLKDPGKGKKITGEVYIVNEEKLKALDELENHPHFYVRDLETVVLSETGETKEVWIYMLPEWREELLLNGSEFLASYNSEGAHNRKYVDRYLRTQNTGHTLIVELCYCH